MSKLDYQFGYKTVDPKEKRSLVNQVFANVASKYDLMNDLMSLGIHRLWKNELLKTISPYEGMQIIDMASGSGDIAKRLWKYINGISIGKNTKTRIVACDPSEEMLEENRKNLINSGIVSGIDWLCADAIDIPAEDDTFDAYTISFGLRNISEIDKALCEAYRILKPGGRFICLEFSKIASGNFSGILQKLYKAYSFGVIPRVGKLIAKDGDSYKYLVESIEQFPNQESVAKMIEGAGFKQVSWRNLSKGIVAIHSGTK